MKKFFILLNYLYSKTLKAQCIVVPIFVAIAVLISYLFTGVYTIGRVFFSMTIMVSALACASIFYRQNSSGGNKYAYKMYCNSLSVCIAHILVVCSYAILIWMLQIIIGGFMAPNPSRIEFLFNHENFFNIIPTTPDGLMATIYYVVCLPIIIATAGLAFARKKGRIATSIATITILVMYPFMEFQVVNVIVYICAIAVATYGGHRALKEEECDD